jgi:hypothetical protein
MTCGATASAFDVFLRSRFLSTVKVYKALSTRSPKPQTKKNAVLVYDCGTHQ